MLAARGLGRRETAAIPVATAGLGAWAAIGELPLRHGYLILADRGTRLQPSRASFLDAANRFDVLAPERAAWVAATREPPPALWRLVAERITAVPPDRAAALRPGGRWLALYCDRHAAIPTVRTA